MSLTRESRWTLPQVTLLTIGIAVRRFAEFSGGLWKARKRRRTAGPTRAIASGAGIFLASFSATHLRWLCLNDGFIGGVALGRPRCAQALA